MMKNLTRLHDEILKFTQELIKIPTENPPGRLYKECIHVIDSKLREFGLDTEIIEVDIPEDNPYPRYCLLASFGEGKKTVYFHGHYDVVSAANKAQFIPYIKNDKLFGRGASDMKGGLASMIYAIKLLKLCNVELEGRISLVIVPDEETGGKYGTKYLFDKGFLKNSNNIAMLMPEPTDGMIWNACRGAISLMLKIKGKAIHVALQHRGVNAFEKMVKVANALLQLKSEVEKRKTGFNIGPGECKRSILMLGGRCEGGINFNIVPGQCSFTIERRINPEEDLQVERETLYKIFDNFRKQGIDMEIKILQEGESAGISSSHPVAQVLASSVKMITGKFPAFQMCPGLLETRFYIKHDIPAFAYGPGVLSVSHSPKEFINIKDIYACTAVYASTAIRLLCKEAPIC